jgi:DNA-binding protein YbaB
MSILSKLNQFKDLRGQAKSLQNQLKQEKITVSSGGVSLTMDGNQDILDLDIDQALLSIEKKNKLENNIKDVYADALKKIRKIMVTKMQASGIKLPGMD